MSAAQEGILSVFVIKTGENSYYGGFDTVTQAPRIVSAPWVAKHFTNKKDIKLRPMEEIVELQIDLRLAQLAGMVTVSQPFRPARYTVKQFNNKTVLVP